MGSGGWSENALGYGTAVVILSLHELNWSSALGGGVVAAEWIDVAGDRGWLTKLGEAMIGLTWQPVTIVEVEDAEDVLESSFLFVDSLPYTVLIDLAEILSISAAASLAFADDHCVLTAALLGETPMDRVLAAQSSRAIHSTRYFSSEPDAIAWLTSYLEAQ